MPVDDDGVGCETMVMNQIELTTSDQNVFQ